MYKAARGQRVIPIKIDILFREYLFPTQKRTLKRFERGDNMVPLLR